MQSLEAVIAHFQSLEEVTKPETRVVHKYM